MTTTYASPSNSPNHDMPAYFGGQRPPVPSVEISRVDPEPRQAFKPIPSLQLSPGARRPACSLPVKASFVAPAAFDEYMVFDIRPYNMFSIARVKGAINICLPTTLLKRPSYNLAHILNSINISPDQKALLLSKESGYGGPLKVLLYDNESSEDAMSFQLAQTLLKFADCNKSSTVFDIYCLQNGFRSISNKDVLEYGMPAPSTGIASAVSNTSVSPISPINFSNDLHLDSDCCNVPTVLSGFALPACTPSSQKFISSIKKDSLPKLDIASIVNNTQQPEKLTNYNYQFKFPDNLGAKIDKLPLWLKSLLVDDGNVVTSSQLINKLNGKFNKIEQYEQLRLNYVISNTKEQYPQLCSPSALCAGCDDIVYKIPKGIEYGLKNRYNNIWPYEHSRVKIDYSPCSSGEEQEDYFNANYIQFDKISKFRYIATQNPLQSTYEDFWKTAWYNKIGLIVCLNKQMSASLLGQDAKYFDDHTFAQSRLSTRLVESTVYDYFILRRIIVTKDGSERVVRHLEFRDWPDFGVPDIEHLINFINFKNNLIREHHLNSHVLVHCSAGCGRTGCFIAIDQIIDLLNGNSNPNSADPFGEFDLIYSSIHYQRTQRISMVQNLDQFIVCYETILHYLTHYIL